jgi:hypothetical protein
VIDGLANTYGNLSWRTDSQPINWYNLNVCGGEIAAPEPATLALSGVAALGLLPFARRRRQPV